MMSSINETLFQLIEATSSKKKNWQLASAIALGVLCGLLPFTSLLPAALLVTAFFIPFHVTLFIATAVAAAFCSAQIHALLALVGEWSLTSPQILQTVSQINQITLAPWLQLNNTVVHGALVVGLIQLLPTYILVRTYCFLFRPSRVRADQARQTEIAPEISYVDVGSEVFEEVQETDMEFSVQSVSSDHTDAPVTDDGESVESNASITRVESFLSEIRTDSESTDTKSIAERAAELAELVDEMLDDLEATEASATSNAITRQDAAHPQVATAKLKRFDDAGEEGTDPASATKPPSELGSKLTRTDTAHSESEVATQNDTSPMASQHEEALRYLLHHLKEIKDKA